MAEPLIELAPELEPAAEASGAALTQIGTLAIIIVVLGMILAVDAIAKAFFGAVEGGVGWIPFAGKLISSPIHKIEQRVTSYLGGLAQDIQADVGHHFHTLAQDVRRAIHSVEDIALAIGLLTLLAVGATAHYVIPSIARIIRRLKAEIQHVTKTTVERVTKIERVTKRIYVHEVNPRLRAIEHRVEDALKHDLKSLRAEVREAERTAKRAEKLATKAEHLIGNKAFEEAVVAALATAGLEWLRCESNPFNNNKSACGLWKDLAGLLGLAGLALELKTLPEWAAIAQGVVSEAETVIEDVLSV